MSKLILVTGGGRSGKSAYAQRLAEEQSGPRAFVATCPVIDAEMSDRVRLHQLARSEREWQTIEEPLDLASAICSAQDHLVVLVDCLTLWVNNILYAAEQQSAALSEPDIALRCQPVLEAARAHGGTIIFVTNEVGLGLVPETPLGRRFRDLAGRVNQIVASACDEVVFVVCGQPLKIKPANPSIL